MRRPHFYLNCPLELSWSNIVKTVLRKREWRLARRLCYAIGGGGPLRAQLGCKIFLSGSGGIFKSEPGSSRHVLHVIREGQQYWKKRRKMHVPMTASPQLCGSCFLVLKMKALRCLERSQPGKAHP